jgi:hypothetical protein
VIELHLSNLNHLVVVLILHIVSLILIHRVDRLWFVLLEVIRIFKVGCWVIGQVVFWLFRSCIIGVLFILLFVLFWLYSRLSWLQSKLNVAPILPLHSEYHEWLESIILFCLHLC